MDLKSEVIQHLCRQDFIMFCRFLKKQKTAPRGTAKTPEVLSANSFMSASQQSRTQRHLLTENSAGVKPSSSSIDCWCRLSRDWSTIRSHRTEAAAWLRKQPRPWNLISSMISMCNLISRTTSSPQTGFRCGRRCVTEASRPRQGLNRACSSSSSAILLLNVH